MLVAVTNGQIESRSLAMTDSSRVLLSNLRRFNLRCVLSRVGVRIALLVMNLTDGWVYLEIHRKNLNPQSG